VIHRADRLDEVLAGLAGRAGAVVVIPLWPKAGEAAKRVVVQARRGARTPLRLAPGVVLHQADGSATPAAQALLRDGQALVA
jgi:tRNA1(Val) A37 N6-methylase TrmN6